MKRSTFMAALLPLGILSAICAPGLVTVSPLNTSEKGKLVKIGTIRLESGKWALDGWEIHGGPEGLKFDCDWNLIRLGGYCPEELLQISIKHQQS